VAHTASFSFAREKYLAQEVLVECSDPQVQLVLVLERILMNKPWIFLGLVILIVLVKNASSRERRFICHQRPR